MADGLLIVDKPAGPTSHDVVARMRRALREPRIGHTGTLDPMATGVLLLVVGKATRLAKFLSLAEKSYDAVVRFGFATDTGDAQGRMVGAVSDRPMPSRAEIEAALDRFRGTFMQQPPAFSAKKIAGQRSYRLARAARATGGHTGPPLQSHQTTDAHTGAPPQSDETTGGPTRAPVQSHQAPSHPAPLDDPAGPSDAPVLPAPCSVSTTRVEILTMSADSVTLGVDCSAGFYIRSLAHDLGQRLGIGAHLTALRRTRTGQFGLDRAIPLDAVERHPEAAAALVPLAAMLETLPSVVLTPEGANRVAHGQDVRPADHEPAGSRPLEPTPFVRLLNVRGELMAIAQPDARGALHPSVVLV